MENLYKTTVINDEYFLYGQLFSLGVCLRYSFIFLGSKAPSSFLTERTVVFSPAQFIQQSSRFMGSERLHTAGQGFLPDRAQGVSCAPGDQYLPLDTLVWPRCCWGAGGAAGRGALISNWTRMGFRGQGGLALHPVCPWSSVLKQTELKHDLQLLGATGQPGEWWERWGWEFCCIFTIAVKC